RQCQSNVCVSGICCNIPCSGNCQTCTATPGMCTAFAQGSAGTPSCAPFLCNGTSGNCPTTCMADPECASPARCVGGRCQNPPANGSACTSPLACMSNLCVDGRCCDSACTGMCVSCNRPNLAGVCGPVAAGTDPRNTCPGSGVCKSTCDANATCVFPGASTICSGAFCQDANTIHRNSVCDGNGSCMDQGTASCAPYHCSGTSCITSCNADAQCISPNTCQNGMCAPLR